MGFKRVLLPVRINSATSLASSFQTAAIQVNNTDNIGIILETSSVTANTGTFTVQVRMKTNDNLVSGWASTSTTQALSNANITTYLTIANLAASEFRISFVPGGGSPNGTVNIWIMAKDI